MAALDRGEPDGRRSDGAGARGRAGRSLDTEHASADDSPGLLLWQVTNRWQAAQRAALKPFELTHVQFVLLASLAWLESDGPVTQKALADHAMTDPMMTSQVLRVLEQRGLLVRRAHPDDKRARSIAATKEGIALANRANAAAEACDRAFFSPLGPASTKQFATALRELRTARAKGQSTDATWS